MAQFENYSIPLEKYYEVHANQPVEPGKFERMDPS